MRAGTLKHRVTLQRQTPSGGDATWAAPTTWVDEHRVWASVQADAGAESKADNAVMTAVSYTIRIRFLADVTSEWRMLWNGKTLDIVSVIDPTGRGHELEIKAIENVANG